MLLCTGINAMRPILPPAGPLCRAHDILFLRNSRFAGLKFPDMSRPVTLDARFKGLLPPTALDFLKCVHNGDEKLEIAP
jgi:hypothetical protein